MNTARAQFGGGFGSRVFADDRALVRLGSKCATRSTVSARSYGISPLDRGFDEALDLADYTVLDGVYFGLACILLLGRPVKTNQGPDILHHFIARLNAAGGRAFGLGASNEALGRMQGWAAADYSAALPRTHSPPYRDWFAEAQNAEMFAAIAPFSADVLFFGMTAPRREKRAHEQLGPLAASLAFSIGNVFDWYAATDPAVGPIWWKLNLLWLVRAIRRPEILKRYPSIGIFSWHLRRAILRRKRFSEVASTAAVSNSSHRLDRYWRLQAWAGAGN